MHLHLPREYTNRGSGSQPLPPFFVIQNDSKWSSRMVPNEGIYFSTYRRGWGSGEKGLTLSNSHIPHHTIRFSHTIQISISFDIHIIRFCHPYVWMHKCYSAHIGVLTRLLIHPSHQSSIHALTILYRLVRL